MVVIACALTAVVMSARAASPAAAPADVVARVNGQPITRQQLDEVSQGDLAALQGHAQKLTADQELGFKRQMLGRLVDREILNQAAAKTQVADLDKKVDAQVAAIKARFPNEQAFTEHIAKAGRTMADLRADVRKVLLVAEFVEQTFASKTVITDEQTKAFYDGHPDFFRHPDMVRASHILVRVPADAADDVKKAKRAAIDQARQRVLSGEDFAQVAAGVSEDPGTKEKGGDLDFFAKGRMVPEFEKAAFALKPGEVSEVVTTQFGYHIIKQTGSRPAEQQSYDKAKDMIARFMKDRAVRNEVAKFLEEQKKAAKIETFLK
jgi:peptidyl-prolyl cis-trans isomerase C